MAGYFAFRGPFHEPLEIGAVLVGIESRPGTPEHAPDVAAFQQREVERHFRYLAGRKSDHQETTFPGNRAQGGLRVAAADGIKDDVDTFAARETAQALLEIFARVIQAELGAMRLGEFKLF